MSLFNLPVPRKEKEEPKHPWSKTIKDELAHEIKQSHNSVKNVRYPKLKEKIPPKNRITFTVWGNRVTKEFIYCVNLVQNMHKYRWKKYAPPVIRAFTGVEWESTALKELQLRFGTPGHCLRSQVAVIRNDELIGGEKELQALIESKYYIHMLALNYRKESIKLFTKFIKDIGRPCAYLHISINSKPIGSLMFMLYSDIVPRTCENFLRLCTSKKGGYSGTPVHRIVKDGWIQCGGFGLKNEDMDCENFIVQHDRRGVLAMANAGRHTDCSTQFFVLLQPHPCFKLRFVAFGQLIDGEETLKKIEQLEKFYEAPVDNVVIYKAGVVNLDCKDIRINKGAREYVEKHIDDLVIIGEMFYALLMDNVFLEIEFRRIQRMEPAVEEEEIVNEAFKETVDEFGNYVPEHIRATRRFIRKKDEGHAPKEDRSQVDPQERKKDTLSRPSSSGRKAGPSENNDFDVESLRASYEAEQFSYSKVTVTVSELPKETKPYYLAMTDVPYPGEIDSTFDLKKYLQGNYCLESDLAETCLCGTERGLQVDKMKAISEIISTYHGVRWNHESSSDSDNTWSENELDSDEEEDIKKYLEDYAEKVSFPGHIIKKVAKNYFTANPIDDKLPDELWNDEEIRRMRLAMQDMKTRVHKKVSLAVEPWEHHTEIKRRQTGFVKPGDLPFGGGGKYWEEEEEEEEEEVQEDDPGIKAFRGTSVSISAPHHESHQIKRRQTGYEGVLKMKLSVSKFQEEEEEEEGKMKADKDKIFRKIGVKIAPQEKNIEHLISPKASKTVLSQKGAGDARKTRPSVLMRLYDDIAIDSMDVPTLKDYKPVSEMKNMSLLAVFDGDNPLLKRNKNVFQTALSNHERSVLEQRRKTSLRKKFSIDSGKSVKFLGHLGPNSLRSLEYARSRPTISVSQYQLMNREIMKMASLKEHRKERHSE